MSPSSAGKVDPPVCVALDFATLGEAERTVDLLADRVRVFKVGLQLFTAAGPAALDVVHAAGRDVFLDLKVHDIPKTAEGAVRSAHAIGARFLTVHASGGRAMLRAAIGATERGRPQLLVVTVVTSLDDPAMAEVGVARSVSDQVDAMAALAVSEGATGLVLSAGDVARVRQSWADAFLLVPGIRPSWSDGGASDDQRRIGDPGRAVADGADMIVLGRSVTAAPDPGAALDRVLEDIAQAALA